MKIVQSIIINCLVTIQLCYPMLQEMRDKGFVYLDEIDPTIQYSLRYFTAENFVGAQIEGYNKCVVILTKEAALALKNVQKELKANGYCLVVYDAYRPQRAVNHFMRWSEDVQDKLKEEQYYPRVVKHRFFDLGYVAKRSGHSRGSTVDVTIINDGDIIHEIREQKRQLGDGFSITFLDDGTVDMGSSFDLFDEASHTQNNLIEDTFQQRRNYLKSVMEKYGVKNYSCEWWHFTLKDEPFTADNNDNYFDFPIE